MWRRKAQNNNTPNTYSVRFADGKTYKVQAESWLQAGAKASKQHAAAGGKGKVVDVEPIGECDDIISLG